jgi:hypothetical protein
MNMSKINYSYLLVILLLGASLSSCKKYFDDVNLNPNDPAVVTPDVLLPVIETRLNYSYWGDFSRFLSIYTQHIDGVSRQFAVVQNYGIRGADVNNMWSNLYSGVLTDINKLKEIAVREEYNHYEGVALTLEAYSLMILTDAFGDMPYSEAFAGVENLAPNFDSQESIYAAIQARLDEAEAKFAEAPTGVTPGSDDLIYGGDIIAWGKFINMIRARAFLHLSERDASNYSAVLTALNSGFTSAADDARLPYEATSTGAAPWYQYIEQRADIAEGANYVDLLDTLNDPRDAFFGYDLMDVAHPYFTINRAAPFISYVEAKFMEAEALMQTEGATANTHTAYLDAIEASFADLGLSADYATYVAQADVDPGQANLTLEEIMTQKYIALYADPEVYNDWRRTGFPSLTPNTGSEVPRRLPYSQDELTFNSNASSYVTTTIFDRVWIDPN